MFRILLATLGLLASPLSAHEFWLDPLGFRVAPGEAAQVHLRVGEEFKGSAYAYIPRNFTRFEVIHDGSAIAVEGRAGDLPAMDMPLAAPGLHVVAHVTSAFSLTYKDWSKFENFARHKDFEQVLTDHRTRGLPETDFRERYVRFAKALIAVGDGAGQDTVVGLETEIVALTNPYTDPVDSGVSVEVLYQGTPRAGVQVELFERAPDDSVTVTLHRTDAQGRATLPVRPGHRYLVDAVVMRPLAPEAENDPVWESLWASLTFAVPD